MTFPFPVFCPGSGIALSTVLFSVGLSGVSITSEAKAGDLALFLESAYRTGAFQPSETYPSGFTKIGTATVSSDRFCASYKILQSADIGRNLTGITGSTDRASVLLVARPIKPITSVVGAIAFFDDVDDDVLNSRSVTISGQKGPLALMAIAHFERTTTGPLLFDPTGDSTLTATDLRFRARHRIFNGSPETTLVQITPSQDGRFGAAYIRVE